MKLYATLVATTLFVALAPWAWQYNKGILRDRLYVRHLPNYDKEVPYPTYKVIDGKLQNYVRSDWYYKNVPWYGKAMYYFEVPAILMTPVLFVITFCLGCVLTMKKKLYFKWKWLVSQFVIYGIIITLFFNTSIMD